MAPTVKQLPVAVDWEVAAGAPSTLSITSSGATITSPSVAILTGTGDAVTGVTPTVSQAGAVTTIILSAADTTALGDATTSSSYRWQLSALVNGQGPYPLVARTLTVRPVGSAATSSTAALSLSVTVGAAAIALSVDLGGPQGPTGTAATIAVGAVSTGAAGSSATVTNAGTSGAAVFDFSIPRGNTGATGATGPSGTLTVGTVTTGAAGTDAAVTNSGTSTASILNFTLPRGATGASVATVREVPPVPPVAGEMWLVPSVGHLAAYDGSTWLAIMPATDNVAVILGNATLVLDTASVTGA